MTRSFKISLMAVALCATAIVLYWSFVAVHVSGPSVVTRNLFAAKDLAHACTIYAEDHGGKFPNSLEELVPEHLDGNAFGRLRCNVADAYSPVLVNWLYFGAGFDAKHSPPLLIASPQASPPRKGEEQVEHRVYITGKIRGYVGLETDYQSLLASTLRQKHEKELHDPAPSSQPAAPQQ